MNKALAEILASVIPDKMERNRCRGLFRYGIIRALKLQAALKRNTAEPKDYLCVCAIAKDEGPYFAEWLDYHISKGVDRFYIYDNGSTDSTRQVLQPYIDKGIVEYTYFPGYRKQIAAYDHCIEKHRFDCKYLAFIDLDEFIVPMKDSTIPEFLARFNNFAAVEINWLVYGSSGARTKLPGGVMQRFTRHSLPDHPLNRKVKSIVNPRRVYVMTGCHEASRMRGFTSADANAQPLRRNFHDRQPLHNVIRINHYAVRSYQEFMEKQARGRASGRKHFVPDAYFTQYDLNDIQDS